MHNNIMLRSAVIRSLREKMVAQGFTEFQTPILSAPSPEGARDYLVPSRLYPGRLYALPQAPQQFKQLLMIAGFDRYFQIAPCFRDEDSRADRSPGEFYQLDVEMSFVEQEDVFEVVETVLNELFRDVAPHRRTTSPFPRISFRDAMARYGTDKPDLRARLELVDVSDIFTVSEFRAFAGKHVRALPVPDAGDQPRSFFDQMEELAVSRGAKGLAWVRIDQEGHLTGPISKFLCDDERQRLIREVKGVPGTVVFLNAGDPSDVSKTMAEDVWRPHGEPVTSTPTRTASAGSSISRCTRRARMAGSSSATIRSRCHRAAWRSWRRKTRSTSSPGSTTSYAMASSFHLARSETTAHRSCTRRSRSSGTPQSRLSTS